jgi:hypothetical protein
MAGEHLSLKTIELLHCQLSNRIANLILNTKNSFKYIFMMKNKMFMFYLTLCLCFSVFGQRRIVEKLSIKQLPNMKLAYTGIIPFPQFEKIYSGFKIGAEFIFLNRKVTINRKSGTSKTKIKENFATLNFSGSGHPFFRRNAMVSLEWLQRTTYQNAFFWDRSVGVGMSRWFGGQVVYKKNTDGSLKEISPVRRYLTIQLMTGIGYDFMPKKNIPIRTYVKGGITVSQWNVFPYINPMAEIGVITSLSTIIKKKTQ